MTPGVITTGERYTDSDRTTHYTYVNVPSASETGVYIVPDEDFEGWVDNVSVVRATINGDGAVETAHASWSGLGRLNDDSVLCVFSGGPWGEGGFFRDVKCTRGWLRPAVFADDFDDGDEEGWYDPSDSWEVVDEIPGGNRIYSCSPVYPLMPTLVGLPEWENYEMSAELKSFDGEAGIVFHALHSMQFFYFSVDKPSGMCKAWMYIDGIPVGPPLAEAPVTITEPMDLRMTRLPDGTFLCYANGTHLTFQHTLCPGGRAGLRVETGTAKFDDVTVHGGYAFLDPNTGEADLLIDDPLNHLNLDGTPYMWGLLGVKPPPPTEPAWESAWEVVDGGLDYGKVLKGTASSDPLIPTEAFRGDRSWISDDPSKYMNYTIQADVKLESATAGAGVCLRVGQLDAWPYPSGDRLFVLLLVGDADPVQPGEQSQLQFRRRRWIGTGWDWDVLDSVSLPNPTQWHTIAVEARDDTFKCYLLDVSLDPMITVNYSSLAYYSDGLVGMWAESDSALFDNVKVLDLRNE